MSSQDDLLHDFETGMAQVLANMNFYMQLEEPLNLNLGETQSLGNSSYTKILSPSKVTNREVETDTEAI